MKKDYVMAAMIFVTEMVVGSYLVTYGVYRVCLAVFPH